MEYTFYFDTEKDAFNFIGNAQEIAKAYGTVSLSDLSDLYGYESNYSDNFVCWTEAFINNKVYVSFNRIFKEYVVTFPDPDVDKSNTNKNKTYGITKSHIVKKESVASPEPLNICVSTEEMKDSCKMLSGVLEMVKQIKDRPVFITIS